MVNSFEVYVDEKKVEEDVYIEGKSFVAKVLPKRKWSKVFKGSFEGPINIFLFKTPISQYKGLEQQILDMEYKVTIMEELQTLIEYNQSKISTNLQPGFLYDLLATGQKDGNRVFAGIRRLSTQEGEIPKDMTLHELKLLALEYLDLSPKEAQNISAKIIPMYSWDKNGKPIIIAGFDFNKDQEKIFGTMVRDDGTVKFYPDDSKYIIRELLKI